MVAFETAAFLFELAPRKSAEREGVETSKGDRKGRWGEDAGGLHLRGRASEITRSPTSKDKVG